MASGGATAVEAGSHWIPEFDVSHFFTKNLAAELVLTRPQEIATKGGSGKQGAIEAPSPLLLGQYHFTDLAAFNPYFRLGLNYTLFRLMGRLRCGSGVIDAD